MNIRLRNRIPIGSTHRVYMDANKEVYLDGAADWSYFMEFMTAEDRIGRYRVFDRQRQVLAEGLTVADAKKFIQAHAQANAE